MLLVAILAILSGQGSLLGMERFSKRHRKTLNELLGTHVAKQPSDSTFRLLLTQLDVEGFETLPQGWMSARIGEAEPVDTLVCDGKMLRGSSMRPPPAQRLSSLRPVCIPTASAWPLPRASTPPVPAVRSQRWASCWTTWSSR